MEVRKAVREDLVAISELAHGRSWTSFSDILPDEAINGNGSDHSPASLKRHLLEGALIVCCEKDVILGFAHCEPHADHVHLDTFSHRSLADRVGAALVQMVQAMHPHLPISRDIVLGDDEEERVHESIGFVPGETVEATVGGHAVVSRRWWLGPHAAQQEAAGV